MPWLLSTAGYGVLVDNPETSGFRLSGPRTGASRSMRGSLRLRVFAGPRPADVLRRLTARIGRQPPRRGRSSSGPGTSRDGDDEQAVLASVAQTYTHYLPCESQARATGRASV